MSESNRDSFGSKLGVVLAAAGSAVGLGNIWRFPMEVGNNGGAAFILAYLCCVFFVAMPVMLGEFVIGRASAANTVDSYRVLSPGRFWQMAGYLGVLSAFLILSFYSVVAGWTVHYFSSSLSWGLSGDQNFTNVFAGFVSHPWKPLLYMAVFLLLTHLVVTRGVQKGIEKFSKLMMPALFLIMVLLAGGSLMMPGASKGLAFLLKPDFSKITTDVLLSAMGQAFFSLSVGIGCMATYASYFKKETPLVASALNVCMLDTAVAVLSGFVIFPAVFSVSGVQVDAGPGLVFITLPNVFNLVFGKTPFLGYLFSSFFYLLLLLAALTSSISMHEIGTAFVSEKFGQSRRRAATMVTVVCLFLGACCSLSFGPWAHITCCGMGFFDLFDFLTAKLFMPVGGILISLFAGWRLSRKRVKDELTNENRLHVRGVNFLIFLLRWVAPIGVGVIFINELFF